MDSRSELRGREGFWRFQAAPDNDEVLPPPPYQVTDVYMSFVGVRFEKSAARRLLPAELNPVDTNTGTICVYSVGSGWGVAPFSACFVAVEVDGYRGPDGSPGYYLATGYYSGRGYQMMHKHYNLHAMQGGSRHFMDGDEAVGIGGPNGADELTIRTRPAEARPVSFATRHYMGMGPWGGPSIFAIAAAGPVGEAEPISVEISDKAHERLQLARPVELLYGAQCTDFSLTFGTPRSIAGPLDEVAARASLLSVFTQVGRAAMVVDTEGDVRVMNPEAEALVNDGLVLRRGQVAAVRPADQLALATIITRAASEDSGDFDIDPILIERQSGRPLIVQALPIAVAVTGKPAALLLITDPASQKGGNPLPTLQLLGLTPAEARIAELVGSGLSPREAAEKIDNAESTVRTSLIRIYQKLDINRQSELARIVARL